MNEENISRIDKLREHTMRSMNMHSLIELLKIAHELRNAIEGTSGLNLHMLERSIPLMMILFNYLNNLDPNNVDRTLLLFLSNLLGIPLKRKKNKEVEEEEELEVDENLKQQQFRFIMYEIYKVMNPERLAGETGLDNFIKNVKTIGLSKALRFEGAEYGSYFKENDLKNLESHRFSFIKSLRDHGNKGGVLGM